jgi:hypothetical protein
MSIGLLDGESFVDGRYTRVREEHLEGWLEGGKVVPEMPGDGDTVSLPTYLFMVFGVGEGFASWNVFVADKRHSDAHCGDALQEVPREG